VSGLSDKHQRFVAEYLIDQNASAAYKRAGYKAKGNSAEVNAARLLRNAQIRAAIAAGTAKTLAKLELTAERVLQEVARIAFFDPRKLFNDKGEPLHLSKLDDDTAAAIAGLDTATERGKPDADGNAEATYVRKYKIADKNTALGHALKVLGLLRERVEVEDKTPERDFSDPAVQVETARRLAHIFATAQHQASRTLQ
jgi:phage terminase small subunit